MKKTLIYGLSAMALAFTTVSCGGGEETTDETTNDSTAVEVVEAVEYTVDTAASIINWYNMDGEEKGHYGTVKVLNGTYTVEGDVITAANLTMDMNSVRVTDEMGGEKLQGHLMAPDFLDVNQFASATFSFDRHEEGMVYGSLNVAGKEMAVEAPVVLAEGSVEIADFKVDMGSLPFFVQEREKAPEAEWHDTNIGFSAVIKAN